MTGPKTTGTTFFDKLQQPASFTLTSKVSGLQYRQLNPFWVERMHSLPLPPSLCTRQDPAGFGVIDVLGWGALGHVSPRQYHRGPSDWASLSFSSCSLPPGLWLRSAGLFEPRIQRSVGLASCVREGALEWAGLPPVGQSAGRSGIGQEIYYQEC